MASKVLKARNELAPAANKKAKAEEDVEGKTIEEIYQKKTQLEHILLRPDTYIGSVESITKNMFVVDENSSFVQKEITFVPGLYKIFDEIIVNAADNKIRDPTMDCIKVTINRETAEISVYNTGRGIPIQMHAKEGVYVPELIFGHLLTSSNYNDSEKKVTGGRNGYGAKLCNIFSTKFVVETCDTASGKKYRQVFRNNMTKKDEPVITKAKASDKDFTCITFRPDLAKFNMTELDDDIVALMSRRVYDVAGTTKGIKVYLNNQRLPVRNFKDYVSLVLKDQNVDTKLVHEVINDRWEVCMTLSENGFQQMSFVNSIATTKGGTHVNYIADQVVSVLETTIKRKNKGAVVKAHQIKNHMWLFINCLIENPSFDSQTKENMTRRAKDFGSTADLSEKFAKGVKDTGIVDAVLNWAKLKSQAQLSKASSGAKKSKISGIPKLDDANEAGGRNSSKCTLILTEGDSAKALAVSGLGVVGRDYYGVFPLRGKLLNVREASHKQIMDNTEIKHIAQIMGLKFGQEYTSTKQLRYGRLMIMTDQDQDGSHIKGLLINFMHHFWPSLLKLPDFLVEFVTPIVKCTKGRQEKSFFTIPQYEQWAEQQTSLKGWKIKYYKGLGTSTPQEAKQYFSHMDDHQIPFTFNDDKDFEDIVMAFSKKHVEARKAWLANFVPGTYLDHDTDAISYSEFINKELILFSMADNVRSIPSIMDGLKPGQRKVLFACFKRKLKDEIKVAQLAGYVSEHSAYHHGEQSLAGTIVNMAQRFVGSNNINLLLPIGQFGTRLQGGKDAASARYIFTSLSLLARKLFHNADDDLLTYLEDDGQQIEPEFYAPIIPMVLVNGSDGIGTGWSSTIPNYNPRDLVNTLLGMIDGQEPTELVPWYAGFEGDIIHKGADKYLVRGKLTKVDDNTIEITELPIRVWTQPYKEFLETLVQDDGKKPPQITDFSQHHTDTTVRFVVTMSNEQMAAAEAKGLYKFFKLEGSISTSNMTLFDSQGRIKKYDTVVEILREFYDVRLRLYQKRKSLLADRITNDYKKVDNKVRFIMEVIHGSLVINNRKKVDILGDLRTKGYAPFPKTNTRQAKTAGDVDADADSDSGNEQGSDTGSDFDYLLGMPMWNLTMERVNKLTEERNSIEQELNILLEKSPQDLWKEDLNDFVQSLADLEAAEEQEELNVSTYIEKNLKKGGSKKKKPRAPRAKKPAKIEGDDDDFAFTNGMVDDDDDDWKPPSMVSRKVPASTATAAKSATANKKQRQLNLTEAMSKPAKASELASAKAKASSMAASTSSSNDASIDGGFAGNDSEMYELDEDEFKGGLLARLQQRKATGTAKRSFDESRSPSPMSEDKLNSSNDVEWLDDDTQQKKKKTSTKTVAPAKKATTTKKKPSKAASVSDDESEGKDDSFMLDDGDASDDDDDDWGANPKKAVAKTKATVTKTATARKTTAAKKSTKKLAPTSNVFDFVGTGNEAKAATKSQAKPKRAAARRVMIDDMSDLDDLEDAHIGAKNDNADGHVDVDVDDDVDDYKVAPKAKKSTKTKSSAVASKAATKKAPASKKKQQSIMVDSEAEDDDYSAELSAPTTKKRAATGTKKTTAAAKKTSTTATSKRTARKVAKRVELDSEADDDEDGTKPITNQPPARRPRRAAKKINYAESDFEDADDGTMEQEQGIDSDFDASRPEDSEFEP
eukprot:m.108253 g.108253  ORF g.108253 m.108253 type:complete len:1678 (-) comp15211_c0_seq2:413-5446(-)